MSYDVKNIKNSFGSFHSAFHFRFLFVSPFSGTQFSKPFVLSTFCDVNRILIVDIQIDFLPKCFSFAERVEIEIFVNTEALCLTAY